MKEINDLPVYEGQDICALDEYSAKMAEKVHKKIEDSKYNDTTINKKISDLQQENKTQTEEITKLKQEKEELEEIVESILPNGQAEGEYITLKDSANYPCKVTVEGNSWQKTREGKNKVNIFREDAFKYGHGVERTKLNPDGTITTDSNFSSARNKGTLIETESNKDYTVSLELVSMETDSTQKDLSLDILAYSKDGSQNKIVTTKGFTFNKSVKPIVTFNSADYEILAVAVSGWYGSGNKGTLTYKNLQVEEGIRTEPSEYEEYGASPSSKYLSKIKNVGDNINLKIANQNLINTEILSKIKSETIVNIKRNSFTIDLSKGELSAFSSKPDIFFGDLPKDKGYVLSYKVNQSNTSFKPYLTFAYKDGTVEQVKGVAGLSYEIKVISAKGKEIEKIYLAWGTQSNGGIATISDIQLSIDETDYKENKQQTILFPFTEGQRLMKGDYLAEDGIHHKRRKIALTGEETIGTEGNIGNVNRFYIRGYGQTKETVGMCTHYKYIRNYNLDEEHVYMTSTGLLYIFSELKTAEELKAFLKEQYSKGIPIEVECEPVEEEIEPYTEEQKLAKAEIDKLKTYKNVTNIFTDSKANLKVDYKKDIETLLNQTNQKETK